MKTTQPLLPGFACGVMLVALSATAVVHAQAETTPAVKPPAGTEVAPAPAPASAPQTATPTDETMVNEIKKHAEICSTANRNMDFEKILTYVPKKLLQIMGGSEEMKKKLTEGNAMLKSRGVTIDSAVIGTPAPPQRHEGLISSLVPMTTNLTTPQGKFVATSHMIAVSENQGATWAFLDTATVNEEKLGLLYPALKGKLKIPEATATKAE